MVTNTKLRRLGYLRQIIHIIGTKTVPRNYVLFELAKWAELHTDALKNHVDSTGIIRNTTKMMPAKRYLDFSIDAKLVVKFGGECCLSKYGKILYAIRTLKSNSKPFILTVTEISFLLNWFLRIDGDFLVPVILMIKDKGVTTLACLQSEFKEFFLARLAEKEKLFFQEPSERIEIEVARNRILNWRRPKKYIEHIIPPRINWLLDLMLLDWNAYRADKSIKLNSSGKNLVRSLPVFKGKFKYITDSWVNNNYFRNLAKVLSNFGVPKLFSRLSQKEQSDILRTYLNKSFSLFDTYTSGKLVASQFLFYTCLSLAINKKILCGFDELKNKLFEITSDPSSKYYFYWSSMDSEGHITKKRKGAVE